MRKPTQDKKTRPRKMKRSAAEAPDGRDLEILKLVYQHRFLDTELLHSLMRQEPEEAETMRGGDGRARPLKYGFGKKALYKRLKRLSETRYLVPHQAMARKLARGFGGSRIAYGIGSKSAAVLAQVLGVDMSDIRDIVSANKVGAPFIQHALEVAKFRILLELACRQRQDEVRLLFWEQGIVLQDWIDGLDHEGEERRFSVYPDAFFGLDVKGKGKAQYFLELDRGTMPITASGKRSDIRKKVFGYHYYRQAKRHSKRYRYRNLPDGRTIGLDILKGDTNSEGFSDSILEPIKFFRVLFVAPGAPADGHSAGGRLANIIGAFPSFGKRFATSQLFWFASPDQFSLERPETIFAHQWLTPNPDQELKSLIE